MDSAPTGTEPDLPEPQRPGLLRSLLRLWPYLRPHRWAVLATNVLAVLAWSGALASPLLVARIIDGAVANRDFAAVLLPVVLVFVVGVAEAFGVWGRRWVIAKPATRFEIDLRAMIFRKLQSLAIARHDGWESGQLLSRAVDDLATLRRFVVFAGSALVLHGVMIPVGLLVLLVLSWQIGLAFLVIAVPLLWVCVYFERRFAVAARRSQDQAGDLATTAEESTQGVRVLKAFGRGVFFGGRFIAQSRALRRTELVKVRLDAMLWPSMTVLPRLAIVFALGYGGYAVVHGSMTLGALVASMTLASFLQWPIAWTGFLLAELNNARTAADRYWEIMDIPLDITDPPDPVALPSRTGGRLRFDTVRFGFPGAEDEVLRGVSFTVEQGETVALVGASGSGKTALLNLVPRLYDVTAGAITIDGLDIARLRIADLRSLVSVAFEDPVLFSASVRENVALRDPGASDAEVRRALAVAQASEFVDELPWGLDTRIGEQGLSLSGGQRQRLALARAVLRGSVVGARADDHHRVIVLDDPLSALDVRTEELVQQRLRAVLADATTLLVAHRPSTAALADRVVVLEDGRIVDEGTHEQLLRSSDHYRALMGGAPR
ncbi:ABC transporter ATP-binding protein [Nocardia callitridis]|uniref:ABC transporter ATP-binding protein n=1 Tax=Nocardia callitridis TaxID=648753 RepID=UPI0031E7BB0D